MKNRIVAPLLTDVRLETQLRRAVAGLRERSSSKVRAGMARFGIPSDHALGVSMGDIQKLGKKLGRSQELASALWETGIYEARLLAAYVGEPARLSAAEMERWCRDFDNWAVVDTLCFKLFDQSPHAWKKVELWTKKKNEFQRRAGFVLLACLAAHDENAGNDAFLRHLALIERSADDPRNFVKKGVSWALRMIGRRNPALHPAAVATARRLAESTAAASRGVGKEALKELTGAVVAKRLSRMGT